LQLHNSVEYISYCELFSSATCALYYFDLKSEHFPGDDCRNSGHKIADKFSRSVTGLRYFLG